MSGGMPGSTFIPGMMPGMYPQMMTGMMPGMMAGMIPGAMLLALEPLYKLASQSPYMAITSRHPEAVLPTQQRAVRACVRKQLVHAVSGYDATLQQGCGHLLTVQRVFTGMMPPASPQLTPPRAYAGDSAATPACGGMNAGNGTDTRGEQKSSNRSKTSSSNSVRAANTFSMYYLCLSAQPPLLWARLSVIVQLLTSIDTTNIVRMDVALHWVRRRCYGLSVTRW